MENYTDNCRNYQSNHFLFCWRRRPSQWLRRHQERM